MKVYADSSFVASLYLPDLHSARAIAWATDFKEPVLISALVILELTNAAHLKVFRRQSEHVEASKSLEAFHKDLANGIWVAPQWPPRAWEEADLISRSHTSSLGTRSLDILHVAAAQVLKAESFLTFNERQAHLARTVGLATPVQALQ